jgi:hypothetical protein
MVLTFVGDSTTTSGLVTVLPHLKCDFVSLTVIPEAEIFL